MALVQHIDRLALARADAERIIADVVAWATEVNARPNARIVVRQIDVFSSYLGTATTLSDVDLIVTTNKPELMDRLEIEPEDFELADELIAELAAISEYISPGDELTSTRHGVLADISLRLDASLPAAPEIGSDATLIRLRANYQ